MADLAPPLRSRPRRQPSLISQLIREEKEQSLQRLNQGFRLSRPSLEYEASLSLFSAAAQSEASRFSVNPPFAPRRSQPEEEVVRQSSQRRSGESTHSKICLGSPARPNPSPSHSQIQSPSPSLGRLFQDHASPLTSQARALRAEREATGPWLVSLLRSWLALVALSRVHLCRAVSHSTVKALKHCFLLWKQWMSSMQALQHEAGRVFRRGLLGVIMHGWRLCVQTRVAIDACRAKLEKSLVNRDRHDALRKLRENARHRQSEHARTSQVVAAVRARRLWRGLEGLRVYRAERSANRHLQELATLQRERRLLLASFLPWRGPLDERHRRTLAVDANLALQAGLLWRRHRFALFRRAAIQQQELREEKLIQFRGRPLPLSWRPRLLAAWRAAVQDRWKLRLVSESRAEAINAACLKVCFQHWSEYTLLRVARLCRSAVAENHLLTSRRRNWLREWALALSAWRAVSYFKRKHDRRLKSLVTSILYQRRYYKQQREQQRRFVVKYRCRRLLSVALRVLRAQVERARAWQPMLRQFLSASGARQVARFFRAWLELASPESALAAARHHEHLLLGKGFLTMRLYLLWQIAKAQQLQEARRRVAALRRLRSFRRFRAHIAWLAEFRGREAQRRAYLLQTFRRRWVDRAFRFWRVDYRAERRRLAKFNKLSLLFREIARVRSAWLAWVETLAEGRRLQQLGRPLTEAHGAALLRRLLRLWHLAASDRKASRALQREAALQWYMTLCSSAFLVWTTWFRRRQSKKARQREALKLFQEAEKRAMLRSLLSALDRKLDEEQAFARRHAGLALRRQARLALWVTSKWRSFLRGRQQQRRLTPGSHRPDSGPQPASSPAAEALSQLSASRASTRYGWQPGPCGSVGTYPSSSGHLPIQAPADRGCKEDSKAKVTTSRGRSIAGAALLAAAAAAVAAEPMPDLPASQTHTPPSAGQEPRATGRPLQPPLPRADGSSPLSLNPILEFPAPSPSLQTEGTGAVQSDQPALLPLLTPTGLAPLPPLPLPLPQVNTAPRAEQVREASDRSSLFPASPPQFASPLQTQPTQTIPRSSTGWPPVLPPFPSASGFPSHVRPTPLWHGSGVDAFSAASTMPGVTSVNLQESWTPSLADSWQCDL